MSAKEVNPSASKKPRSEPGAVSKEKKQEEEAEEEEEEEEESSEEEEEEEDDEDPITPVRPKSPPNAPVRGKGGKNTKAAAAAAKNKFGKKKLVFSANDSDDALDLALEKAGVKHSLIKQLEKRYDKRMRGTIEEQVKSLASKHLLDAATKIRK